jgi:2-desacetyl-2-hydroxyethyl bacteriochlorophyllide A dehydrogenase
LNKADLFQLNPPLMIRLLLGGGRLKPKEMSFGIDMAGRVETVGRNVKQFKPGDEVFGTGRGAFAEYACAGEDNLALKSKMATYEESAALPVAGTTALQALGKAQVRPGQKILIDGASGGVGTFAVQIAKAFGADVTAVCSTQNVASARSIGADRVIDYTKEDFAKDGQKYDSIIEVNGYRSILRYGRALNQNGTYVMAGSSRPILQILQSALLGPIVSKTGRKKMSFMGVAKINRKDLDALKDLLETGKIKPVIDRGYPLSETAEAFRYFAEGHARGKVVISSSD